MLPEQLQAIVHNFSRQLEAQLAKSQKQLQAGDLQSFENELAQQTAELYNRVAETLISEAAQAPEMEQTARLIAQQKGLGPVRQTEVTLQLRTGYRITIRSWYAERSKSKSGRKRKQRRGPNGSGCHLLLDYWGCIYKATPGYYSYVAQLCVLCPSFEIATRILNEQGIAAEGKRVRLLAYSVASRTLADRVHSALKPGENLKGKRVLISVDGGRTRTRVNKKKGKKNKRQPFDTPWKEPKLFVIHTVNTDGKMSAVDLPVNDATMGNADECFALLAEYLKALQIQDALEVLVIADGADWIWDRVKPMLRKLGVAAAKITEAVDYYHAGQHLKTVIDKLVHLKEKKRKTLYKRLKKDLWRGKVKSICREIAGLANDRAYVTRGLAYFQDAPRRFQYDRLRQKKWPCGSGIVESAVRRVINLRFKSPSTFWNKPNVEGLIFLRAAFLTGRWAILMRNLVTSLQFLKNKKNERNCFNKKELHG
jgi:hypothetical protein